MPTLPATNSAALERLNRVYFSDPARIITCAAGDTLLEQGEACERLFLILEGSVLALRHAEHLEGSELPAESTVRKHEVFRAGPGSYIGVQSFFSGAYRLSNDIIALEDCRLAYIDKSQQAIDEEHYGTFEHQFIPVLIHELAERNKRIFDRAAEKQEAQRLVQRQEMAATLGQLSAGIAHELNNAVGVITRRTDFVAENLTNWLEEESKQNARLFLYGYEDNSFADPATLRRRARKYENELNMPQVAAKVLAHIVPDTDALVKLGPEFVNHVRRNYRFWELGHDLRDMQMAARHATGIVRAVKLLGGGNSTRQEGVDVAQSVRDAMNLLTNKLKHMSIETELGELPPITADITELVQIWLNILTNACDAIEQAHTPDPRIRVRACALHADGLHELPEDYVCVSISNNGPAIPEEIQEKIFQPSFTTKKLGLDFGLGLGLSIVRRLVDSYKGTIEVHSNEQETTFTISLPTTQSHGKD